MTVASPVLNEKGKPLLHHWSTEGARFYVCSDCNHVVQQDRQKRWLHWGSAREECA